MAKYMLKSAAKRKYHRDSIMFKAHFYILCE